MNSWMSEGDQSLLVVNVDVTEKKGGSQTFTVMQHCTLPLTVTRSKDDLGPQ